MFINKVYLMRQSHLLSDYEQKFIYVSRDKTIYVSHETIQMMYN